MGVLVQFFLGFVFYGLVCGFAWNQRWRWLSGVTLLLLNGLLTFWAYVWVVILSGPQDAQQNFMLEEMLLVFPGTLYLLLCSVFIVINNNIAKIILITVAHLILLGGALMVIDFELRGDFDMFLRVFRWILTPFLIWSAPIWFLGFRLLPGSKARAAN
jgi:hypothetical protein